MTLLASHLEQISLSAKSIAELQFPPPKIFTNALLNDHEITTLIRDTEPHERALFSIDPHAVDRTREQLAHRTVAHENGLHARKSLHPGGPVGKTSLVGSLLGSEILQEVRHSTSHAGRAGSGVNVEVLLRGAEKLCEVYAVSGVPEKIRALRHRYRDAAASISTLEAKVARQQSLLERRHQGADAGEDDEAVARAAVDLPLTDAATFTDADFETQEAEIHDLETRKKLLEDRVADMERDLGGLLR